MVSYEMVLSVQYASNKCSISYDSKITAKVENNLFAIYPEIDTQAKNEMTTIFIHKNETFPLEATISKRLFEIYDKTTYNV